MRNKDKVHDGDVSSSSGGSSALEDWLKIASVAVSTALKNLSDEIDPDAVERFQEDYASGKYILHTFFIHCKYILNGAGTCRSTSQNHHTCCGNPYI